MVDWPEGCLTTIRWVSVTPPSARRTASTSVWLAAFVAASLAGPGVVAAFPAQPAEPTLGDLVTSDAPQGYQQTTLPGLPSGDSTMEEFGRAAGMEIPGLIADVPVSSRAWISGSGVLILMILDGRAGLFYACQRATADLILSMLLLRRDLAAAPAEPPSFGR